MAFRLQYGRRMVRFGRTGCAAIVLLLLMRPVFGAQMSALQAVTAVQGWLKADPSPLQTSPGRQTLRVAAFPDEKAPRYYVVFLDPDGCVIVSADDRIEPIIAFVPHGTFDPAGDNPFCAMLASDLAGRLAKVESVAKVVAQAQGIANAAQNSISAAQNKWAQLQNMVQDGSVAALFNATNGIATPLVAPLVQTQWSQQTTAYGDACFNYYTPPYAEGAASNFPCGCTATAMAQVMRYWKWPIGSVGTGAFPYEVLISQYVEMVGNMRGGDGAGGPYDWNNMLTDPLWEGDINTRKAIGALCHDVGLALDMTYRVGGSGAWMSSFAFTNVFGYGNAIRYENYETPLTAAQLLALINPNLDAGCPVMLGIAPIGHAIVCDGYGYNFATIYHHLNYGWAGVNDLWYTLPQCDNSFTTVTECVYNIWTNGTGEIISGRIVSGDGSPLAGVTVTAVRAGGGVFSATSDVQGVYALARIPSLSVYTISAQKAYYTFAELVATTRQSTCNAPDPGNFWGANFSAPERLLCAPPSFQAIPALNLQQMDLAWQQDPNGDPVLVAWSTNGVFGTPSGTYTAGDAFPGGGTVLYNGSATSVSHLSLTPSTTYYYRAWSVRDGANYSAGASCSNITLGCTTPLNFVAAPTGRTQMHVFWQLNPCGDSVMVAWNTNNVFGAPAGAYVAGDALAGGGTIFYNGTATSLIQSGLTNATTYYYRAWSVRYGTNYSASTAYTNATLGCTLPLQFAATPVSRTQMQLSWHKDACGDAVMVVWSTNAIFGIPSGTHVANDSLPGGGVVLYNGSATSISHTGLVLATTYYYQAWSVYGGTEYSPTNAACSNTTLYCVAPSQFTVAPASHTQLNLAWQPDLYGDNVMLAWNTNAGFGVPSGSYAMGDALSGGGTVLYHGTATSLSHTGLVDATCYYYQAWSVYNGVNYSTGVTCSNTTLGIATPVRFQAKQANSSRINLWWTPNVSSDNVMAAWNYCPTFGMPMGVCSSGDVIPGGGTVLCNGSGTNVAHLCLASTNTYYYQAWSVRGTNYSLAVACAATTSNRTAIPFQEGFASCMPEAWSQIFVIGVHGWSDVGSGHPGNCAAIYNATTVETKLITPLLDFGTAARNAQLTFYLWMPWYGTTQDELRVYYTNSTSGAWTLLATYTNKVPSWSNATVALPDPDSSYRVAFDGLARDVWGVCIDEVSITACYPATNGFTTWAQIHCPGASVTNAFSQNYAATNLPNGFEYAFGTNLALGEPLLNMRCVNGRPVVDVPKQLSETLPYVQTAVETTGGLNPPVWTTGGLESVNGGEVPANRAWFQLDQSVSNAFFRLRGTLME